MYPKNIGKFMDVFGQAVANSYGHLLVDLKPTTPSHSRLKPNALARQKKRLVSSINKWQSYCSDHSDSDSERGSNDCTRPTRCYTPYKKRRKMDSDDDVKYPCNVCGLSFTTIDHLMNHAKETHWKVADDDEGEEEDGDSGSESESEDEDEENLAFLNFRNDAIDYVRATDEWEEAYNSHKLGNDESEAINLADEDFIDSIKKTAVKLYRNHLRNAMFLMHGTVHNSVRDAISQNVGNGYDKNESIRMALKSHKSDVQYFFESDSSDDDGDSSDEN